MVLKFENGRVLLRSNQLSCARTTCFNNRKQIELICGGKYVITLYSNDSTVFINGVWVNYTEKTEKQIMDYFDTVMALED